MHFFQLVLITGLLFTGFSYFARFRKAALDKILITGLIGVGIVFVVEPDRTTQLARMFGIGRGADLVFYVAILTFGYIIVVLYGKIRKLEEQVITLARQQSLANPVIETTGK